MSMPVRFFNHVILAFRADPIGSVTAEDYAHQPALLEKVGDVYTRGRPLWQIRLELAQREAAGESVALTVVDRHVDERRDVVLQSVQWSPDPMEVTSEDGVQIIKLNVLEVGVATELEKVVKGGGPVVIDLRKLVWGFESEAVAAADVFIDGGVIGSRSGRQAGEELFEATEGRVQGPAPVVLIGPDTEGVGEILASALGRHGSPLVGWDSAGHAPHMRLVHSGGLFLWIPVSQWLGDDGEPITGAGLEPSEKVEFFETVGEDEDEEGEEVKETDAVLVRGIELALEGAEAELPALADAA